MKGDVGFHFYPSGKNRITFYVFLLRERQIFENSGPNPETFIKQKVAEKTFGSRFRKLKPDDILKGIKWAEGLTNALKCAKAKSKSKKNQNIL